MKNFSTKEDFLVPSLVPQRTRVSMAARGTYQDKRVPMAAKLRITLEKTEEAIFRWEKLIKEHGEGLNYAQSDFARRCLKLLKQNQEILLERIRLSP